MIHPLLSARIGALFATGALLFSACYSAPDSTSSGPAASGGTGGACTPDIESIRTAVFAKSCLAAGCHGAADRAATLDLESPDVASRLVGVASGTCEGFVLVAPGSLDQSLLFRKIAGTAPCGSAMPVGGALTNDQRACLEQWIAGLPAGDGGASDGAGGSAGGDDGGCETCGGSACVDLQGDPAHCGNCATACPAGGACSAGACSCAGGLTACGTSCVDVTSDSANCGGCGQACPSGAGCAASSCVCPGGGTACSGACVDTSSNASNCGACGHACSTGQVCSGGSCASGCGALEQCGTSCVDTQTSTANCGACGNACPSGASCSGGTCSCPSGTSACGGACINTATDPSNCGGCAVACKSGQTCQGSSCACPTGQSLCGGVCLATTSDPNNCGACGHVCAPGQTCASGTCACGTASVSFSGAIQPIFTSKCATAGCHGGVVVQQGLSLASGKAYSNLVNVNAGECTDGRKRVLPGDPSASYLVQKLLGVSLCGGTQMPKSGGLGGTDAQTISNWICAGAPNN